MTGAYCAEGTTEMARAAVTALVALVSLVVLFRWTVSNPLLMAADAIVGLVAFPLVRPEWSS